MANNDTLQRFIFENRLIRGEIVHLRDTFQSIVEGYPAPIRQLLGEALCAAALLSAVIKFNGKLTLQFSGKGKLKLLLAQCDHHFHVRGLAKWDGEMSMSDADLMGSFKEGVLGIVLDAGLKSQYQGIVSWQGNSLAESIEGYFKNSEQLATKIWLRVNQSSAAGLMLQVVPSSEEEVIGQDDPRHFQSDWERVIRQTASFYPEEMLELDNPTLLVKLYPDDEIRLFPSVPVVFKCTCTRKKGENAILLLGRKEAEAELSTSQTILVTCDFCHKKYTFDKIDVAKIFEKDQPSSTSWH